MTEVLSADQLSAVHQLLDRVSARQRQDFGHATSDLKSDGTPITACDRWSDATFVGGLAEIAPGEGILSEEGSKQVPESRAYWVVDPLDGTTNFAAGIPYWAISIARFVDGRPSEVFLDVPALSQRIVALQGRGAFRNGEVLTAKTRCLTTSNCVSLCSRSIRLLQRKLDQPFPGKIRLLGVASLNLVSVAMGQTVGALEATPRIWDLAAAWLVLEELDCPIRWLGADPSQLYAGQDLSEASFPMLAACSWSQLTTLLPWGEALIQS
ncbi:inositol monophosphatase family protein [Synechococcus sp. M16CYN]|uniref:inositol monophosphatase family protein n=1 Tax=Synechococcus sp. M16CYN TaxID=3103139 RepID=UPI0032460F7F